MPQPRILVVDDDLQVLDVLNRILSANGFDPEVFCSARALLATIDPDDVGCVVADLEMPDMSGMELQTELIQRQSCLSLVVVTGHADVQRAIQVMGHGAVMLLEKPFKGHQLVSEVSKGVGLSEQTYARRKRIRTANQAISLLTDEELQVMKLAAHGLANKTIGYELSISQRTVDRRRQSALLKLGIASVAEFALMLAASQESE